MPLKEETKWHNFCQNVLKSQKLWKPKIGEKLKEWVKGLGQLICVIMYKNKNESKLYGPNI